MAPKSLTAARKRAVLAFLRKTPTIRGAAQAAGLANSTIHRWARQDSVFAAKMEEAIAVGVGHLENAVFNRAINGVETPLVYAGKIVKDEHGNALTVRKYSDALAVKLLQAHGGPAYRDKSSVNLRMTMNPDDLTDEQLAAIAARGSKPPADTQES